jgi:FAD dependent oxidoreductase.
VPDWVAEQRAGRRAPRDVDAAAARRLAPGLAPDCLGGVYSPIDGQAEAMATVEAFAAAARRLGAHVEEGVGARKLAVEGGRVVGIERGDGARQPCDASS